MAASVQPETARRAAEFAVAKSVWPGPKGRSQEALMAAALRTSVAAGPSSRLGSEGTETNAGVLAETEVFHAEPLSRFLDQVSFTRKRMPCVRSWRRSKTSAL